MYAVQDKPSRTRKYPSQLLKSYGPVNADQKKEYLARAPMTTRASQIWQEETSQATSTMRCHVCKAEYTTLKASSLVSCQDASRRIRCLSRGVNAVYWKIYWSLWCRAAKPLISLLLRRSIQQRTCSSLQRAEEQVYPCRDEAPPNVTETFSWHETLNTTRKYHSEKRWTVTQTRQITPEVVATCAVLRLASSRGGISRQNLNLQPKTTQ